MNASQLAFSIPTNSTEEQRELFDSFRAQGFNSLQLKGGQYARYIGDADNFRRDWGENCGASALICGGDLDENGVVNLRAIVDFASEIGSEMIVFCHGRRRETVFESDIANFARQLSQLGEASLARGVKLSLHHHFDNPVMHRKDFETFFSAATPNAIGLTLDTAHAAKSGIENITELVRDFGAWLDNVHLKDFRDGQFQMLGTGEIDFAPILHALQVLDYHGALCADEESGASIENALRDSAVWMQRNVLI